jgi:hypothetical protein
LSSRLRCTCILLLFVDMRTVVLACFVHCLTYCLRVLLYYYDLLVSLLLTPQNMSSCLCMGAAVHVVGHASVCFGIQVELAMSGCLHQHVCVPFGKQGPSK